MSRRALRSLGHSFSPIIILLCLSSACGDDVAYLNGVISRLDTSCPGPYAAHQRWALRSIRVEVIEWDGGQPGDVRQSECIENIDGLSIMTPYELMDWFDERGYIVRQIPGEVATKIQIVGFLTPGCEMESEPLGPVTCGITDATIDETEFSDGDSVSFFYSCIQLGSTGQPTVPPVLMYCLAVGSLPND